MEWNISIFIVVIIAVVVVAVVKTCSWRGSGLCRSFPLPPSFPSAASPAPCCMRMDLIPLARVAQ
jgi:hypothetical protein